MASFGSQSNHEVRSLRLKELVAAPERLAHLSSVPVVMANYRISSSWLFGSSNITQRLPDVEPCSGFETLGAHLQIPLSAVESSDTLAVSSSDARAIQRALRD
jgi:hypothetical protein